LHPGLCLRLVSTRSTMTLGLGGTLRHFFNPASNFSGRWRVLKDWVALLPKWAVTWAECHTVTVTADNCAPDMVRTQDSRGLRRTRPYAEGAHQGPAELSSRAPRRHPSVHASAPSRAVGTTQVCGASATKGSAQNPTHSHEYPAAHFPRFPIMDGPHASPRRRPSNPSSGTHVDGASPIKGSAQSPTHSHASPSAQPPR